MHAIQRTLTSRACHIFAHTFVNAFPLQEELESKSKVFLHFSMKLPFSVRAVPGKVMEAGSVCDPSISQLCNLEWPALFVLFRHCFLKLRS